MTDNELLLAISNMMDTKLEHLTKDVKTMKEDIREIKIRIENVEIKVKNIELNLFKACRPDAVQPDSFLKS